MYEQPLLKFSLASSCFGAGEWKERSRKGKFALTPVSYHPIPNQNTNGSFAAVQPERQFRPEAAVRDRLLRRSRSVRAFGWGAVAHTRRAPERRSGGGLNEKDAAL